MTKIYLKFRLKTCAKALILIFGIHLSAFEKSDIFSYITYSYKELFVEI
jgi:hypothetical protein